jgi:hypothetical protein
MSKSPPSVYTPDLEAAVRERYAGAARARESALCCPTSYDSRLLEAVPDEVIERDYGCGDPSRYLRAGETVLDLGSGTGKVCFIAAQVVVPLDQAQPFPCSTTPILRDPRETKGEDYKATTEAAPVCKPGGCC